MGSVERGPNMQAFGVTIHGALVQQRWVSNQGVFFLARKEADEDGLALLEEVL